eukprot:CAMPEP_0184689516 /NCGR_PEP_ID=MMETSP0312-20130426/30697_1 /TAXON_ID=31354 /ORGANISM="Compsopogon coeruleus, Strain SAG 36.94" /LENGTH=184 /DNA_ID=CAMNT_0027146873 /DNA_START=9 /DNA_END=563 /DNA_ORIENTATION=+
MTPSTSIQALPYLDSELTTVDGLKRRVEAKIANEMEQMGVSRVQHYLGHRPSLSMDWMPPMAKAEWERVVAGRPMEPFTTAVREPPVLEYTVDGRVANADNVQAQVARLITDEMNKLENLEMQVVYGPRDWKLCNERLEREVEHVEKEAKRARDELMEVHLRRKKSQLSVGAECFALEQQARFN